MKLPLLQRKQQRVLLWLRSLFAIFIPLCATLSPVACNNTSPLPITVFTGEWSPYITHGANGISSGAGGAYGITADVVTAVLREMNYEPDYQFRQWSVIENQLKEKKIHSAFPFVRAASREDHFCFSDPIGISVEVLFYNRKNIADDISASADKRLGTVAGYEYDQSITSRFVHKKVFANETEAFRALISGSIDLLPAEKQVGLQMLEQSFLKDKHKIGIISGFEKTNDLHLVMPSNGPQGKPGRCDIDFLERFNFALQTIEQNGVLGSIKDRYQHRFETNRQVQLLAAPGHPLITAVDDQYKYADNAAAETPKYLVPQGTRAVVVEWNPRFLSAGPFRIDQEIHGKTKVRILEGPLKDQVVWVPNVFITMAQ